MENLFAVSFFQKINYLLTLPTAPLPLPSVPPQDPMMLISMALILLKVF